MKMTRTIFSPRDNYIAFLPQLMHDSNIMVTAFISIKQFPLYQLVSKFDNIAVIVEMVGSAAGYVSGLS